MKKNSLKKLTSRVISNESELDIIEIDNGLNYDKAYNIWYSAFENVNNVTLSSIF